MQQDKSSNQILKTRDDPQPIRIEQIADNKFKLSHDSECSWCKPEEEFGPSKLRERIEPWLTALFQSDHLSMLIGSGLTHAIYELCAEGELPGMDAPDLGIFESQIQNAAQQSAERADRGQANFEDTMRVANELLVGLVHQFPPNEEPNGSAEKTNQINQLRDAIRDALDGFAESILEAERGIVTSPSRTAAFGYLVNFLMSPASRSGTRDRLQIFTTNYDRLIEAGAEVAGIHLIDRFVGSIAPILRSSRLSVDMHYNPPGIRGEPRYLEGVVRFTKLHGSLDWVSAGRDIRRMGLPFGSETIKPYFGAPGLMGAGPLDLMIYPNSAKDRETAEYPYIELFRDFAAATCRPNSTLITYGFSFGDEHIIRVIEDMLTIPSAHLVVIAHSDPMDRIMKTFERVGRPAQMTLLLGNHLGSLKMLVERYLPKPAIDRTTIRMADLLKSRFGTVPASAADLVATAQEYGDDS